LNRACFALSFALLLTTACDQQGDSRRGAWIDLSHDFSSDTVYWPTAKPFKLNTVAAGMTDKGYYYSAYQFCAAEHGGTHIDAPIHFAKDGRTVDQIPLTQLIGPAIKIDVSDKALADPDYQINIEDLIAWESRHGKIPKASVVFVQTGFGRYWPNRLRYLGTAKRGPQGVAELHFPGLHPDAARWLVANRGIKAVGIDTASIDYGQSRRFGSHVALMRRNVPALENVANLDELPATGARTIALPMKIKGGSGGPVRIIAFVPAEVQ
jgi:kynurenine formamidase